MARTFASPGKGGLGTDPSTTAMLCIEFQNEFATVGGKLHNAVRPVMETTGMLDNTSQLANELRQLGVKVFHAPITFAADGSNNPNKVPPTRPLTLYPNPDLPISSTSGSWQAATTTSCSRRAPGTPRYATL
jgi:nicotinamidase-related amidase